MQKRRKRCKISVDGCETERYIKMQEILKYRKSEEGGEPEIYGEPEIFQIWRNGKFPEEFQCRKFRRFV